MHIKYGSALLLMVIPSAVLAEQYFKNSKYPIDLQPTNHCCTSKMLVYQLNNAEAYLNRWTR